MEHISYKILQELFQKNNHIRGLSSLLGINHMTISRKMTDLEKENILDYAREGKNKVYFIKKSLEAKERLMMMEHFKLLTILKKNPRLRKIVDEIKKSDISLAILFGSYANETNRKESDIDLYIDTKKHQEKLLLLDSKLGIKYGKFDKNSLLVQEITKNHVIIKGVELFYESIC
jgi:predicted nucleotidyltransferase